MTLPTTTRLLTERIVAIDALRGFALLGILLVHMVEQYVASPPPSAEADIGVFTAADSAIRVIVGLLLGGKFFALYSLLFGVRFYIQLERSARCGGRFASRFAWRLAILFAAGMVHHLFYRGDILAIYAALGFLLLPLNRLGDRALLGIAAVLALGGHRVVLAAHAAAQGGPIAVVPLDQAALEAYFAAIRSGSLGALFASNLTDGLTTKLHFQFGWMGRGWQTLALFIAGLYIGRRRWHEQLTERRRSMRLVMFGGLGLSAGAAGIAALAFVSGLVPQSPDAVRPWHYAAGLTLYDLFNLGLTAAIGGGFVLACSGGLWPLLRRFSPVGQTALSSYLSQSAIGVLIFYGFGLGLLGRIPLAFAFLLGLVIFAGQMIGSALWLRAFRHGPVEWLWRSLTDWRMYPLRRTEPAAAAAVQANP